MVLSLILLPVMAFGLIKLAHHLAWFLMFISLECLGKFDLGQKTIVFSFGLDHFFLFAGRFH